MNDFAGILAFLFERKPEGTFGQMSFAAQDKKAMLWVPNNKGHEYPLKTQPVFYGVMPGAFRHRDVPQHDQACWACWAGADFDDLGDQFLHVIGLLSEHPDVSVRTSSSGKGLHAFLRFQKPILMGDKGHRSRVCKGAWRPLLDDMGLLPVVDKIDYRTFYVVGGHNEWVKVSDRFHPAPNVPGEADPPTPVDYKFDEPLAPAIKKVVDILAQHGVKLRYGSTNIYTKQVYEALLGTHYEFQTKSPMRSERHHINGFISLTPTTIQILPNADNMAVLTVRDPQYYRDLLGGEA